MAKRGDRQHAIRTLVRDRDIRTQKELAEQLQQLGFDCTQATVSRDVSEMGLVKSREGNYALSEDIRLRRLLGELAVSAEDAGNLVVVKTRAGSASMVAEMLDNADIEGMVGTIAGDNTILAVTKTEADAARIAERLSQMM